MRQTVIITGATKGLGRATALEFAKAGHRVVGTYSTDQGAAQEIERELKTVSSDSVIIQHDVRDEATPFLDSSVLGQPESLTLINNACAAFTPKPFHLIRWDEVQNHLDIGLKGSWNSSQAVIKNMIRAGRGTIVNILTTAVHGTPPKGFSAYLVAKQAIRGLTLSLASEFSSKGIRVFSVSPGFMATSLTAGWDHRLTDAMGNSPAGNDPATRAHQIVKLVEDPVTIGAGEDYLI